MKKLIIVLTVVGLLVIWTAPALAITWGWLDENHPNVGAMVVDFPGYGPFQWCSGTLVHPRVFLTAGHCTVDLEAYDITTVWVNFDQYALNPETMLLVEQVITHPDYHWGATSDPHDVGILILAEPVEGIQPATLPPLGFLNDLNAQRLLKHGTQRAMFTAVGYGGTLDFPPPQVQYDDLRRYSFTEYQSLLRVWLKTSQNQKLDNGGTCFGDSGGPIFWTNPDGSEVLVGLTSWGDSQCVASGFNYRVDIPETLNFIASVVSGLNP